MLLADKLNHIRKTIPGHVSLVVISKTQSPSVILEAYRLGQKVFGENKVQELVAKFEQLPKDIEWHLVGHLQSNKTKYIAPFVHMIHSVDSLKILKAINREAEKNKRVISCLLQIHIAEEETKFGMTEQECRSLLESGDYEAMQNVSIAGLMGMATFTDDMEKVRREFRSLKVTFDSLKSDYFKEDPGFRHISMGMSDDYLTGIAEGSTMVRIGSAIFGERMKA